MAAQRAAAEAERAAALQLEVDLGIGMPGAATKTEIIVRWINEFKAQYIQRNDQDKAIRLTCSLSQGQFYGVNHRMSEWLKQHSGAKTAIMSLHSDLWDINNCTPFA